MGLPISQCEQKFNSMDVDLRGNMKEWLGDIAEKYGLDDLSYGSFEANYGYVSCGALLTLSTAISAVFVQAG